MKKIFLVSLLFLASCGTGEKRKPEPPSISPVKPIKKAQASVVKVCDGLTAKLLKPGTDKKEATNGDRVRVHYAGWLEDKSQKDSLGRKFDSSVERGTPFSFVLGEGRVIKGWEKGVVGMKVGEKRRLTIDHTLAYGERGFPGAIPPRATLIFDVELLGVE